MRILISGSLVAVLVCALSGCRTTQPQGERLRVASAPLTADGEAGARKKPSAGRPQLTSVALYSVGEYTGHTTVGIAEQQIVALYPALDRSPRTWGELRSPILDSEKDRLLALADKAELRSFRPKSEWFGKCPFFDVGSDLVLTWTDREVVYAVPPREMRKSVPQEHKDVYRSIDSVVSYLDALESKYSSKGARIQLVPVGSPQLERFDSELSRVTKKSLPERQIGW